MLASLCFLSIVGGNQVAWFFFLNQGQRVILADTDQVKYNFTGLDGRRLFYTISITFRRQTSYKDRKKTTPNSNAQISGNSLY